MTVEGPIASSTTATDEELIAEVAPPMLKKFKDDGFEKGALRALTLIALSLALQQMMLHSELEYRFAVMFAGIAVAMVALAILPIFFRKQGVLSEVRYRRQHGKWRWER